MTVRQGSPLAIAFGIESLKEETSRSGTLGFAYRPDKGFSPAGCTNPTVCPARVLLASVKVGAANFFTNAIDTRTTGIDIVAQYASKMDRASVGEWRHRCRRSLRRSPGRAGA